MTIFDRKNDFNEKFLSLCEKNCVYKGYNYINKTANCECKTNNVFPKNFTEELDVKDLVYQFIDFDKISNLFVITCHKVLFTSAGVKTNAGSYFITAIIAGISIFSVLFYLKGFKSFQKKINDRFNQKFLEEDFEVSKTGEPTENDIKLLNVNSSSNIKKNNLENLYNDYEINDLDYEEALKHDKRTFFQRFKSQIKMSFLPAFTFFMNDDYNSSEVIISLFLFGLSLDFAVRALFFNDSTMHKIYKDKGTYNFLYQIPIIIYPLLISFAITKVIKIFSDSETEIARALKNEKRESKMKVNEKINELMISFKRKFSFFFILLILFNFLFWYYSSSFCAVFKNTQITLIKDTVIGYGESLLFTIFAISFFCSIKFLLLKKNCKCLYKPINCIGDLIL